MRVAVFVAALDGVLRSWFPTRPIFITKKAPRITAALWMKA
jgi:hypothetical protein